MSKPKLKVQILGEAGAGKSTVAQLIQYRLMQSGIPVTLTDGLEPTIPFIDLATGLGALKRSGLTVEIETIETRRALPGIHSLPADPNEIFHSEAVELSKRDWWGEHPDFSRADWRHEAGCGDTQRGYWNWISAKLEERDHDDLLKDVAFP